VARRACTSVLHALVSALGRACDRIALPFGPSRQRKGEPNGRVSVQTEMADGTPAEPATLATAVPSWRSGDTIPLGRRTLRVVRLRDDDADQPPVLVVEDVAG
jgi:hypothetical protein